MVGFILLSFALMDKTKVSDNILNYLKLNGPQTAHSMADAFAITPMAIRQHLYLHYKNQLVDYTDQKTIRGRPKRLWKLTEIAEKKYDDNTPMQMSHVIHAILDHGYLNEKQLVALYKKTLFSRFPKTTKELTLSQAQSEINKLIFILDQEASELGYLFEYAEIGKSEYILTEHHEPLKRIAEKHQFIKNIERDKYQIILGNHFEILCISHILDGHYCSKYKLSKRT